MFRNSNKINRNGNRSPAVSIESLESRCLMSATIAGHVPVAAMQHPAPATVRFEAQSHRQAVGTGQHGHVAESTPHRQLRGGMAFKGLNYNHNQTLLRG